MRQQTDRRTQATLTGKQRPAFLRILSILTSALAVMALATASFGQTPTFVNPSLFDGGSVIPNQGPVPVVEVVAGDFNNDGEQDLITLGQAPPGWGIMLGNGDGTFQPVVSIASPAGYFSGSVVTGDFNNDGNLDFAVTYGNIQGQGPVAIYLGNGAGGFTFKASYSLLGGQIAYSWHSGGLVAVDLRGNGHLDLIALDHLNQGVDVFLGNGDGTFQSAAAVTLDFNIVAVTAGDVNNDGKPDLVVATQNGGDGIYVLLGKGDGTFQPPVFYDQGSRSFALSVAIGQLIAGDHGDVVMGAGAGAYVYLNNGDGTFKTPVLYGPQGINSIVIADVNGDKKNDLVVSSFFSDAVWFMPGDGKGGFGAALEFATNLEPDNVVVADFNGDKKLDFATSDFLDQWVTVALGNGDGTFRASQGYGYSASDPINAIATADLNGDGSPDIVTGGGGTGVGIAVQLGSSHGALGKPVSIGVGPCGGESNGARNGVNSIALGDVTGDGKVDVVTTSINDGPSCATNEIGVLAGSGTGTFKAPVFYSTGVTVQSYNARLGDFNGDGKLDIVVSNADGSLSVLLNKGKGIYGAATVISAASGSFAGNIVVGDFNKDGKMDIAVTNFSGTAINVLLGKGDGTFQAPIINPSPMPPGGLAAGDFNKDGKLDLALTDGNNGTNLTIFTGNGDGTFTVGNTYNITPECPGGASNPYYIGAADLNQDGNLDLAIALQSITCGGEPNVLSGDAVVFFGHGDGTFQRDEGPWLGGGSGTTGIALADFNNDGMTDIVVASADFSFIQALVSILQNKTQPVSVSPLAITYKVQAVGTSSKAQTVILTNDQGTSLAISSVTLGGTDPGDFILKSACGSSLLPGADCTETITFKPTVAGKRTATLSIKDAVGTQTVSLTGTGEQTIISFTPPSGPVGTSVTITGTGFTGTTKVTFNGTSATFTVNSSTQITATVPTGATTGKIGVTTNGVTVSSKTSFTVN